MIDELTTGPMNAQKIKWDNPAFRIWDRQQFTSAYAAYALVHGSEATPDQAALFSSLDGKAELQKLILDIACFKNPAGFR